MHTTLFTLFYVYDLHFSQVNANCLLETVRACTWSSDHFYLEFFCAFWGVLYHITKFCLLFNYFSFNYKDDHPSLRVRWPFCYRLFNYTGLLLFTFEFLLSSFLEYFSLNRFVRLKCKFNLDMKEFRKFVQSYADGGPTSIMWCYTCRKNKIEYNKILFLMKLRTQ